MRFAMTLLVLGFVLVSSVGAAQPSGTAFAWTVYLRRAGPVRIGMSLPQVRRALADHDASFERNPTVPPEECTYLRSSSLPGRLGFMFERWRLVRIDVIEPGIRTASGIGIGSTEGDVERTYPGRIQVGPHKYDPKGHYLRYVAMDPDDRSFGMAFETNGERVTSFRTGTVEAVALVEGCA